MGLQAAVWDKEPSKLHAVCAIQADQALINLTILCPSFRLGGVDLRKGGAQIPPYTVTSCLLQTAWAFGPKDCCPLMPLRQSCLKASTGFLHRLPLKSSNGRQM